MKAFEDGQISLKDPDSEGSIRSRLLNPVISYCAALRTYGCY
jgi:hypothetical protein